MAKRILFPGRGIPPEMVMKAGRCSGCQGRRLVNIAAWLVLSLVFMRKDCLNLWENGY